MPKIKDYLGKVEQDLNDRKEWTERVENNLKFRLGERRNKPKRWYQGQPDYVDPIIDENVRTATAREIRTLFDASARMAVFLPLNEEGQEHTRRMESAFDTMLRLVLGIRGKLTALFDMKNSIGMATALVTENNDVYKKLFGMPGRLPDFEPIDPRNVVVPTRTTRLRDADRLCHIARYSVGSFKRKAKELQWDTGAVDRIVASTADRDDSSNTTRSTHGIDTGSSIHGVPKALDKEAIKVSDNEIVVHYYYHWRDNMKWRCTYCPDVTDDGAILSEVPWIWTDGIDREWPVVQFRFEDRTMDYYDVRGISDLTIHDQEIASAYSNLRQMHWDFHAMPMVSGARDGNHNFRLSPGAKLPDGIQMVQAPKLDAGLVLEEDRHAAKAARHAGSGQGSIANVGRGGERKTATEVINQSNIEGEFNNDGVARFSEGVSDLFQQMWDFVRHNPINLPILQVSGQEEGGAGGKFGGMVESETLAQFPVLVQSTPHHQSASPLFQLQQILSLQSVWAGNPHVEMNELTRYMFDLITPRMAGRLVIDPSAQGEAGMPSLDVRQGMLEQALGQMGEQMRNMQEFVEEIARSEEEEERQMEEEQTQAAPVEPGLSLATG
jgi:hypothetical protein